jgi:hypothetical protein
MYISSPRLWKERRRGERKTIVKGVQKFVSRLRLCDAVLHLSVWMIDECLSQEKKERRRVFRRNKGLMKRVVVNLCGKYVDGYCKSLSSRFFKRFQLEEVKMMEGMVLDACSFRFSSSTLLHEIHMVEDVPDSVRKKAEKVASLLLKERDVFLVPLRQTALFLTRGEEK